MNIKIIKPACTHLSDLNGKLLELNSTKTDILSRIEHINEEIEKDFDNFLLLSSSFLHDEKIIKLFLDNQALVNFYKSASTFKKIIDKIFNGKIYLPLTKINIYFEDTMFFRAKTSMCRTICSRFDSLETRSFSDIKSILEIIKYIYDSISHNYAGINKLLTHDEITFNEYTELREKYSEFGELGPSLSICIVSLTDLKSSIKNKLKELNALDKSLSNLEMNAKTIQCTISAIELFSANNDNCQIELLIDTKKDYKGE